MSSDNLFLRFDRIIEAALKSLSTGALDGRTVLYLMKFAFTVGNLDSMSKLRSVSFRYARHWLVADTLEC